MRTGAQFSPFVFSFLPNGVPDAYHKNRSGMPNGPPYLIHRIVDEFDSGLKRRLYTQI